MRTRTYADAGDLLADAQGAFDAHEAANSLILGVCGRLVLHPQQIKAPPLLKTVEDERGPLLVAMMTPPHKLVVYSPQQDVGEGVWLLVHDLVEEGWAVPGVLGPGPVARGIAEAWAAITGQQVEAGQRQRVYELREVLVPVPERGQLRVAVEADTELVAQWWQAFHEEIFGQADREESSRRAASRIEQGDIFLWQDGPPVSMAMKTRPTKRGISVSLVYTPPVLRGKGYATACVGELSRMLLGAGWQFCALFADLGNAASNRVYQKIGYRPVCVYEEYVFFPEEKVGG